MVLTASTRLMVPPLLLQESFRLSVPPFLAPIVPWLVQLVPLRSNAPEARPSPRAVGSTTIVPRLSKPTALLFSRKAAPVTHRLDASVTTEPDWEYKQLPV